MANPAVIKADLDELVFRARNKTYGSYVLRREMPRRTMVAFLVGSSLFIIALLGPAIARQLSSLFGNEEEIPVVDARKFSYAELTDPPPIDANKPPPPPPDVKPPPPPARAAVKFVPPEVVKDKDVKEPEQTIANIDTFKKNVDAGVKDVQGDPDAIFSIGTEDGEGDGPVEIVEDKEPDPNAFVAVEKNPEPVNMDAIKAAVGYPPAAKEAGIKGQVTLRILVDKTGAYEKHVIVRSPHQLLTDAVVKEVRNLKFTPGIQGGKPIRVWVTIPFKFQLQ